MRSITILIVLALSLNLWSQEGFNYPDDVYQSHIGIEFKYSVDSPHLVIVDSGAYYSFDEESPSQIWYKIPNSDESILRIRELASYQFVLDLVQCCKTKGCPDARVEGGCYLAAQDGEKFEFVTIDKSFLTADRCGYDSLIEIIECFKKFRETTANNR